MLSIHGDYNINLPYFLNKAWYLVPFQIIKDVVYLNDLRGYVINEEYLQNRRVSEVCILSYNQYEFLM